MKVEEGGGVAAHPTLPPIRSTRRLLASCTAVEQEGLPPVAVETTARLPHTWQHNIGVRGSATTDREDGEPCAEAQAGGPLMTAVAHP